MPLPLGGNVIKRDLGPDVSALVCKALRDSIQYALDHRVQALEYAMQFARDLDTQMADKFVGMYVNERTLDYGEDGRAAVAKLLDMGYEHGVIPHRAKLEWAGTAVVESA
jgi:1,4-dihydroxy-6-naphthoate synthase